MLGEAGTRILHMSNIVTKKIIIKAASAVLIIIAVLVGIVRYCKSTTDIANISDNYISVYEKLNAGVEVNVLIVGDSIAQGTGASQGNSWASLLEAGITSEYGSACNMTNISMGGNTSIAGIVREMALDDGISYDLAIICYGENDLDDEDFAANYEGIIRGIKGKYSGCSIVCVLESSQREYTNKINKIIEIADYYSIPVADTIAAFNDSGKAYEDLVGAPDDLTHPNDLGHRIYYDTVIKVIRDQVAKARAFDEGTHKYDHFVYYSKEDFKKDGSLSFVLKVNPIVADMALSRTYISGENGFKIFIDGNLMLEDSFEWSYGFEQEHITEVTQEPVSISNEIKIVFATRKQADAFSGLALYY